MADKGFGVKEINLIGAAGVPTIESPNNLNLNAVNVAISTDVSAGGNLTLSKDASLGRNVTVTGVSTFTGTITGTATTSIYAASWVLGADGTNHYTFTGDGLSATTNDPEITLQRGQKYIFKNRTGGHPFRIQTTGNDTSGTAYNTGVTNNAGGNGTDIIFEVPHNAPQALYYQCTAHANMSGKLNIAGYSGSDIDINTTGVVTATSFSGGLSGNVTGVGTITGGTIVATAGTITTLEATSVSIGNSVTGISTFSGGVSFKSSLREAVKITAGKLSANTAINLDDGMLHYFTTTEDAVSAPNIISGAGINTDMAIGDVMTLTVITVAGNTAHYVDAIHIDGLASGITTCWVGGSKPSDGGGSNVDTYAFNILKTANATYTVVANQVKTS